ncbi:MULTISPECIES: M14 family zinc carboxypeptidase [Pseudomonadati]|uniref:Peptidase M14 n=1 Tax=Shewanella aestuarii TaxID=1028752 RepID=A0ABT0L2R4_9GAMM|nr:M14 family zinc carboxypeptidase [Shewanella aestuarii]MCL1118018.1 peptidase M14 [Shewanella aestuarii]
MPFRLDLLMLITMTFMRFFCLLLTGLLLSAPLGAQPAPSQLDLAMSNVQLDKSVTSPAAFLGYPLGEWHLRHDQINFYLNTLANQSPRVSLDSAGFSHEAREQLTAVITSDKNQRNLAQILQQRSTVKQGSPQQGPLVIWLAYSIHGDEASGAHAAIAFSYYLAASQEPWVKQLLEQAVVLITPSQNPDGFDRFATWANNHKGQTNVSDENHREHWQDWPTGRGNHYFADLNRDWLFLRHKASQGRVAFFHKWQPHYVGDFHEMWHSQSYFFQPGVIDRIYPLTPIANHELTERLADFHRKALDEAKQVYFSGQLFDDFFYGKGSTYPDINGSVGVLFEQASARGQAQASANGVVTFQTAIANHFATSISSVQGALALKQALINYQTEFFSDKQPKEQIRSKGRLIRALNDTARRDELIHLFNQHQIQFNYLTKSLFHSGQEYRPIDSIFVADNQPQQALLNALFDKRTDFKDPTFYDISTWDIESALALNVVPNVTPDVDVLTTHPMQYHQLNLHNSATPPWPQNSVALLINWQQSPASGFVNQLLTKGVQVKFSNQEFSLKQTQNQQTIKQKFVAGSLQIPVKQTGKSIAEVRQLTWEAATKWQVDVIATASSANFTGIDLGSDDFTTIKPVVPMIISGYGSDAFEVGEIWYYLDKKLSVPVSLVNAERINSLDLSRYTHVFMTEGNFSSMNDTSARKLGQFVQNGGVIIAQKAALTWLNKRNVLSQEVQTERYYHKLFNSDGLRFSDQAAFKAKQHIGGAIVNLALDSSHPLTFGMPSTVAVMKNKPLAFETNSAPFTVAGQYQDQLLSSGYMAQEYQRAFANKPAMMVERKGKGAIVGLADNMMFRNIWLGSEKVYANALYFIQAAP